MVLLPDSLEPKCFCLELHITIQDLSLRFVLEGIEQRLLVVLINC
jgi:hypothetical protein